MSNELIVKGTQEFLGKEIPVIEGGFGEGKKVMLAKTIAEIHEKEVKEINKLINDNINEFKFGIDILDLKTGNLEKPVRLRELRKQVAKMKTIIRERELEKVGE